MTNNRYQNVLSLIFGDVWAIMPDKLAILADVVAHHAEHGKSFKGVTSDIDARFGKLEKPVRRVTGKVAVLPLYGIMANRANLITNWSGGTSTEQFGSWFDAAMADESIGNVILDVNSPGGSVHGLEELSKKIYDARDKGKRIIAIANPLAASAAYWVATAADELVVAPGGLVGSVGSLGIHTDRSGANEQAGLKYTYITAGDYKAEGNPNEPLGDEAREYMQSQVDHYYAQFVQDVARNRGITTATVKRDYGQGRVLEARQAVEAGMADHVGTLESVLAEFGATMPKAAGGVKAEDEGVEPESQIEEEVATAENDDEARRRQEQRIRRRRIREQDSPEKRLTTAGL